MYTVPDPHFDRDFLVAMPGHKSPGINEKSMFSVQIHADAEGSIAQTLSGWSILSSLID
jgi:hypothetical protein